MICCIVPIATDVLSWIFLAPDYNPARETISNLAVGPSSWAEDVGLWFFVVSCLSVVTGSLWGLRPRARSWRLAMACLFLVAAAVGTIARVNEYAGTTNLGANVHAWTVAGMAAVFALTTLLAVPGLRLLSRSLSMFSLGLGIAWIVLCGGYLVIPDNWTGAYERMLAVMMLSWLAAMSRRLFRSARGAG